ncbi:Pentatricopeptide repeat-containing protein DOT4, chloroplastic [Linum perenne]
MAGIASLNYLVSPWRNIHSQNRVKPGNSFIIHNPAAESTPSSSTTLSCSYATIPVPELITRPTDQEFTDLNEKISQFCEVGNLEKAMGWLRMSEKADISSNTYCALLQLCAELKNLRYGKEVHSTILSCDIPVDGLLGTRLVFMYVSCGELREGRLVFDDVANEKVFLWNLMLNEYAKLDEFAECLHLFRKMLDKGIAADSYTFSCILKCFGASGSVKHGEWVHGYLLKFGFDFGSCSVPNSLMSFYFKAGRVESARKVFDKLSHRDVISWNSMMSGYAENGESKEALEIFRMMVSSGFDIDLASAVIVLSACGSSSHLSLGKMVHALGIKLLFNRETKFSNVLLDMYSKCGDLNAASIVFENTDERCVVSWTAMIQAYARAGVHDKAIQLFEEMKMVGKTRPDIFTLSMVLHACACSGSLESGKSVHNYIIEHGLESNLFVCNSLMDMYSKCGSMEDASLLFSQMQVKDIIAWNTIIGGYSKNDLPHEAICQFATMAQGDLGPDGITMSCVLPACASLAALETGREIHSHILRKGYLSDRHVANALVDMYVKCGALVLAKRIFDTIPSKDLVSWTVMIAGYGMHGLGKEAIEAFQQMRQEGIEPDQVSFVSVLYACSHSGLVNEGWRFFNIMQRECNIEPNLEHYACIVNLLSRSGKLQMAYKFIKAMPIKPDATIWGSLLCGCRIHHDVKLAEEVSEHVFELEPENTGYYVLLSNIYAEAEKWEEVRKMREKIGRRGLKKHPGCSWIDVNGRVHVFVAADSSHPETGTIEAFLKEVRYKMMEEGYSPKLRYALRNGDDVEKEMALCGHSEKLAMAYGILSLPPGKTVRVFKNLRVCRDCHEMAKFMSKSHGKEIILRDSNFFHHFKDGSCSCRGFW